MTSRTLMMMRAGVAALTMAACARTIAKLAPAPTATLAPNGHGAMGTDAGVRVVARADAWEWNPSDLWTQVTPILLDIQNDGDHPIQVRYNRIVLTDSLGHRFNVMPPYDISGTVTESQIVQTPYYGFNGFTVAPYLSRWYPRFSRYDGSFDYDATYYSPYLPAYQMVRLPTTDMVQRALPEGVLAPGGRATGFVYFEALHRDARVLTLTIDLIDPGSHAAVGAVRIPFVAR